MKYEGLLSGQGCDSPSSSLHRSKSKVCNLKVRGNLEAEGAGGREEKYLCHLTFSRPRLNQIGFLSCSEKKGASINIPGLRLCMLRKSLTPHLSYTLTLLLLHSTVGIMTERDTEQRPRQPSLVLLTSLGAQWLSYFHGKTWPRASRVKQPQTVAL